MIDTSRQTTAEISASRLAPWRGGTRPSRQSRMSMPLSLLSAIVWVAMVAMVALLALSGTTSLHAGDVESWVQHPAIHATVSHSLPAAHRAPLSASSHRRAAPAFGAPLAADTYVRPLREISVSRAESSADSSVGAQVVARGYDATAPPLA